MATRSGTALFSLLILATSTTAFVACRAAPEDPGVARLDATPVPAELYLATFPKQESQRLALCERGNQDEFARWYCRGSKPSLGGLEDLLVGLKLKDPANPFAMQFAMTAHSTSLVGRNTSSLNPRVVIFTPVRFDQPPVATDGTTTGGTTTGGTTGTSAGFLTLGFARGSHLVEIAAFDPAKQDINFYLLQYGKRCDPDCDNAELFTPETETHWTSVTVYGDPDLKNTPLDCLQCHQPAGLGTRRILRMQERQFPWTHWFFPRFEDGSAPPPQDTASGVAQPPAGSFVDLVGEFTAAHPGEGYGGVPADMIFSSSPPSLEQLVESNGYADQPNEFMGSTIESEGRGPTWLGIYANALVGSAISVPSYKADPFDPFLLGLATKRYLAVQNGLPGTVPNMSALYADRDFGDLGFRAADSAKSGSDVVQHRCAGCHSGKFPGISRNNFDVHQFPGQLSPTERALVLTRIRLDASNPKRMPPAQFSDLTEAQIGMIETSLGE